MTNTIEMPLNTVLPVQGLVDANGRRKPPRFPGALAKLRSHMKPRSPETSMQLDRVSCPAAQHTSSPSQADCMAHCACLSPQDRHAAGQSELPACSAHASPLAGRLHGLKATVCPLACPSFAGCARQQAHCL